MPARISSLSASTETCTTRSAAAPARCALTPGIPRGLAWVVDVWSTALSSAASLDGPTKVATAVRKPTSIVVVLPAHHALARRKRIPVEALHDLPCITMDRSLAPALHDAIAMLYRQTHIRMHAVSQADNVLGHLQLVQEGLGFALLPDSVGSLLPPGVVLKPLAGDPTPMVSIAVAWKSGNTSPLVRGFVDLVRQSSGSIREVPQPANRRRPA
jgi:hypothetical protein